MMNTPIPFKNFDPEAWKKHWVEPDWRGRGFISSEMDVFDYLDRTSRLYQIEEKTIDGWIRHVIIIHKTFNDTPIILFALTQQILSGGFGGNSTWTYNPTWNNSSNTVECIGNGGSGGRAQGSAFAHATGGGAGAYSKITNFSTSGNVTWSVPLGTSSSGSPGVASAANGTTPAATYWNATSNPGVGTDNTKCSAAAGNGGLGSITASTTLAGGAGGLASASWGQTKFNGGAGGAITTGTWYSATGGGAAGLTGTGGAGVNATATGQARNGGAATGDAGGTAGTGVLSGNGGTGGTGTGIGGTAGAGGGGGGSGVTLNGGLTGGSGGTFGGGGGAAVNQRTAGNAYNTTGGAGGPGAVILTWTPTVPPRSFGWIIS